MATQPVSFRLVRRYVAQVAVALLLASVLVGCATMPPQVSCADCASPFPPDPNG